MATQIQLRHDSGSIWTLVNPILAQGELGIELDTTNIKVGDGITSWNNLSYIKFISSSFALTASYAMNGGGQSLSSSWASASISSSFASAALTASYISTASFAKSSSLSITSSYALNVANPTFFNTTNGLYYTITLAGTTGNEWLVFTPSSYTSGMNIAFYNATNGLYYTITLAGSLGNEWLVYTPN